MTKRSFFVIGSVGLLMVLVAGTVTALYAFREPPWDPAYFTPSCQVEYATLEQAFAHYVDALQADEPSLYNRSWGTRRESPQRSFPFTRVPTRPLWSGMSAAITVSSGLRTVGRSVFIELAGAGSSKRRACVSVFWSCLSDEQGA